MRSGFGHLNSDARSSRTDATCNTIAIQIVLRLDSKGESENATINFERID